MEIRNRHVATDSQADHVYISLLKNNATTEFAVQDVGDGLQPGEVNAVDHPDIGMGIFSMKERVELAGGSFTIQTSRGSGTLVRTS